MAIIWDFLFENGGYSPHGFCIAWNPVVLFLHVFSDLLIASSYFAIPAIILVFLSQRKDPALNKPASLFALFITACGLTHLVSILSFYVPIYGFQGILKLFTGIISFVTAIALARMLPDALKIPAPQDLLQALAERESEILVRQRAETETRAGKRALAQTVKELKATNDELKEFAYAASHDLKSPANSFGMWLRDFKETHARHLNQEGKEALQDATQLVEHMHSLVDDVLKFSMVVDRDPDEVSLVDLNVIFADAQAQLTKDITSTGARIDVQDLPVVQGHAPLLSVLAVNLLKNALTYVTPVKRPRISIVTRTLPNGETEISIIDNGIGIAPEYHDRIFQLFKRLHTRDAFEGTGLGLALCRRIAISHGWSISVRSDAECGAEFILTLPKENVDVAHAA